MNPMDRLRQRGHKNDVRTSTSSVQCKLPSTLFRTQQCLEKVVDRFRLRGLGKDFNPRGGFCLCRRGSLREAALRPKRWLNR
jgi:hypothetical protein